MFRSLWFKLVGAFAAVILVMSVSVMSAVFSATQREFGQFLLMQEHMRSGSHMMSPDEGGVVVVQIPPSARVQPGFLITESLRPPQARSAASRFAMGVQNRARVAVGVAVLLALILGTVLFWQITRPLDNLRQAAQALADGQRGVRVKVTSKDEIGKVAETFNHMVAQLEHQEQLRKQMVADIAHELRTPLAVVQGGIEAMIDGVLEPDPVELAELHDEVRRLARLVDDLRLLSLADAGQLTLSPAPVEVGQLVDKVVGRMASLAEAQSATLRSQVEEPPLVVLADADRLQQALTNLVDNAIRHTPPGGQVTVRARRDDGRICLSVEDEGPGIPAEDLPYIFERFWRGDKSRSRDRGGSGLGLSIVKQLVELHGGSVSVHSVPSSGSIFTIALPPAP